MLKRDLEYRNEQLGFVAFSVLLAHMSNVQARGICASIFELLRVVLPPTSHCYAGSMEMTD